MRRAIPAIAAVLCAAGCASTSHTTTPATAAPKTPASAPASTAAAQVSASPSPTAPPLRTATIGQPITVNTKPDGTITVVPGRYQVTVTAIKAAAKVTDPGDGYTAKADPGKVIGCIALTVKNIGTTPGDLFPFMNPSWESSSGQVAATELPAGVSCSALGITDQDLSGNPSPGPGQSTSGSDTVEFPAGPGALVFTDRSGSPLFAVAVPAAK